MKAFLFAFALVAGSAQSAIQVTALSAVLKDDVTDLTWLVIDHSDRDLRDWDGARRTILNIDAGGSDDWIMPTVAQLSDFASRLPPRGEGRGLFGAVYGDVLFPHQSWTSDQYVFSFIGGGPHPPGDRPWLKNWDKVHRGYIAIQDVPLPAAGWYFCAAASGLIIAKRRRCQ